MQLRFPLRQKNVYRLSVGKAWKESCRCLGLSDGPIAASLTDFRTSMKIQTPAKYVVRF